MRKDSSDLDRARERARERTKELIDIIAKQYDEIKTLKEINEYLATSLAMANKIINNKVKRMKNNEER